MNTAQAIDRSASHSEIVHLGYDAEVMQTLTEECDDHVEANDVHEFWGSTHAGVFWRVHMLPRVVGGRHDEI